MFTSISGLNHFSDMNSFEIKSEDSDFIEEFMDLQEFIETTTTGSTSPTGSVHSPFDTNTFSFQIPDNRTSTSVNGRQSLEGQQMVNNSAMGMEVMPNLDNLCQKNLSSSTAKNSTADEQNEIGTPDCNSSLGNGVIKDRRYWDRRVKNNIAAKRSRDAKRLKETTVVKRWTLLEEENKHLKEQIKSMKRRLDAANRGDSNLSLN